MNENRKIKAHHLSKTAYLYIRQSTIRQVQENTESTLRQYALREKLVSFGWDSQMIEVIDNDLGHSGKTTLNRDGFKQLVANVANGMAGAVACIEASRLSRSSSDWGRLIEYCAMTDTVLIDADGVYNPNDFNDRLLLGLKGTMSEAELHFLQERMRGGLMNKVKRGELKTALPIGYVHDECGRIVKDPDVQVRSRCFSVHSGSLRPGVGLSCISRKKVINSHIKQKAIRTAGKSAGWIFKHPRL